MKKIVCCISCAATEITRMRRTIIQVVESLLKVKPYYTCKKGLPLLHSDFLASVIFYIFLNSPYGVTYH